MLDPNEVKANGGSTSGNGKTDEERLAEKKATDSKTFSKEEVKEIKKKTGARVGKKSPKKEGPKMSKEEIKKVKAQAKGVTIADVDFTDQKIACAVCGMPIFNGQAVKSLPADAKNGRRYYHDSTCGPGSKNWATFREGKAKVKINPKLARKAAIAAKKAEKEKARAAKREAKEAHKKANAPKKEHSPAKKSGPREYKEGSQIAFIVSCLKEGMEAEHMVTKLAKKFPEMKCPPKFYVHWSISKIRRDHKRGLTKFNVVKSGKKYSLAKSL